MISLNSILNTGNAAQTQQPVTQLTPNPPAGSTSGMSFGDVLDTINPLQHIPVLSSMYRAATGSQISNTSQIAGDTLYGAAFGAVSAVMGFASSVANVAVKSATGEDISQHIVATVSATSGANNAGTATALVPNAAITPATAALGDMSTLSGQAANATRLLSHNGSERSNAQYQRVQALDTINQHLLKMTL